MTSMINPLAEESSFSAPAARLLLGLALAVALAAC